MDDLVGLIVILSVVSALGGLAFWGLVAWLGVRAAKALASQANYPGGQPRFDVDPQFAAIMSQMQVLITQARAAQGQLGAPGFAATLPPETQMQFNTQLLRAQQHMQALDRTSKDRHETFVAGMLSDASAAGIDVSGWKFDR